MSSVTLAASTRASSAALFDWDGTVFPDYTVLKWSDYLQEKGVVGGSGVTRITKAIYDYYGGKLSHDQLCITMADEYATLLSGFVASDLDSLAEDFVRMHETDVFGYARRMFFRFHQAGVRNVVVSGAPAVVLRQFMRIYPLKKVYGLEVDTDSKGRLTPSVGSNPGISARKAEIARDLADDFRVLAAFGNSSSDVPLLLAGESSFIVDAPVGLFPSELAMRLTPLSSDDNAQAAERRVSELIWGSVGRANEDRAEE